MTRRTIHRFSTPRVLTLALVLAGLIFASPGTVQGQLMPAPPRTPPGGPGGPGGPAPPPCSGDCCSECEDEDDDSDDDCPPPPPPDDFTADPVALPDGRFVLVETDFSMVERGVRFMIQRSHVSGAFIDEEIVTGYSGDFMRGRNLLFGGAWNSTLQMYSYWGYNMDTDPDRTSPLQRVNLGGSYVFDLPDDPNCTVDPSRYSNGAGKRGCFAGPGSSHWYRFWANTHVYYPGASFWYPNEGILTARDGMKYYFDHSCSHAPGDWTDGFVQLIRRKQNRYGQGYDYEYGPGSYGGNS